MTAGKNVTKGWERTIDGFFDPKKHTAPSNATWNKKAGEWDQNEPESPSSPTTDKKNNNNLGNLIGTGLNSGGFEGTGPTLDKKTPAKEFLDNEKDTLMSGNNKHVNQAGDEPKGPRKDSKAQKYLANFDPTKAGGKGFGMADIKDAEKHLGEKGMKKLYAQTKEDGTRIGGRAKGEMGDHNLKATDNIKDFDLGGLTNKKGQRRRRGR